MGRKQVARTGLQRLQRSRGVGGRHDSVFLRTGAAGCDGEEKPTTTAGLTVARFNLEWLTGKNKPTDGTPVPRMGQRLSVGPVQPLRGL